MTDIEFAEVMAYIEVGVGKEFGDKQSKVYWDLLGDLPVEALQIGAKRVLLAHPWSTLPSVAELRAAAVETMHGVTSEMSPAEAWALAWKAVGRIDPEVDGSVDRGCKGLPPLVVEAMRVFGIAALCYGKEPLGVVRAQFTKIYEQLQNREQCKALLPAPLVQAIEQIGKDASLPRIADSRPGLRILQDAGYVEPKK